MNRTYRPGASQGCRYEPDSARWTRAGTSQRDVPTSMGALNSVRAASFLLRTLLYLPTVNHALSGQNFMLRRDFILRMIEEFAQALARIRALKKKQRWREASVALDTEFEQLIGDGARAVTRLSETELLTRLMRDGPTHLVRDKTFMLATLLNEAGEVAASENRMDESRECHLKALHLLLDTLS